MDRSEDKTVINVPGVGASKGNWLSKGHLLQGRYVIEDQLGAGGFGITYLAKHRYLEDIWVAIKEYLPDGAAVRDSSSRVRVISERYNQMYSWGLHRFLDEARLLRQFKHPNIVSVQDFFEANSTAYLVMDYIRGRSLQSELDKGTSFSEEKLRTIVYPLLDALRCIHEKGLYHRDISPDNILLREKDDTPVLIDFGSARYDMRMHGMDQIKDGQAHPPTAIFKQGFSPIEQYEGSDQGPFTDIYALGATLYRIALNFRPPDALKRSGELRLNKIDPLEPATVKGKGKFSHEFLQAIDAALQLDVSRRPQTIDAWVKIFGKPQGSASEPTRSSSRRPFWRSYKTIVGAVIIAAGVTGYYLYTHLEVPEASVPTLLAEAGRKLEGAPFADKGLDSARNLYLRVLTLDQENTKALSGYGATTTLKQFAQAIRDSDLRKASDLLNKGENELRRAGLDIKVLMPGKQQLQLLNIKVNLRREVTRQPLSSETWSDVALLLDEMADLQEGESLAAAGRRGVVALQAVVAAANAEDFETAWRQIVEAEQQFAPLGITELEAARSQIRLAQRNWHEARTAKIEALLTEASQHLSEKPLTAALLVLAQKAYRNALDLDSEQPRARAGLTISNKLSEAFEQMVNHNFAAADKALSEAIRVAGNSDLWTDTLEEMKRQLAAAHHSWEVSETRNMARTLLAQAAESLLAAPFDAETLSAAEQSFQKSLAQTDALTELAAETEAATVGVELVLLLQNSGKLLNQRDFVGALERIDSEKARTLSYRIGLGRPFLEKARHTVNRSEIQWSLDRAATLLNESLSNEDNRDRALHYLQRVQEMDGGNPESNAALHATLSLGALSEARRQHDYDAVSAILQQAQPPLIALGVSAGAFESLGIEINGEQQSWLLLQQQNLIKEKLSKAIELLQNHPFDTLAWSQSEALFTDISLIEGGREQADAGRQVLMALQSAEQANASRQFEEARTRIAAAEKLLTNLGQGNHLNEAHKLVAAATQAWEQEKQEKITAALASAEQILADGDLTQDQLQQADQAFQLILNLEKDHPQGKAGLTIVAAFNDLLQALQTNDFETAERQLATARTAAQSAQLGSALLQGAENLVTTRQDDWHTNQTRQQIQIQLQRVSDLLSSEEMPEENLALAEKALQEVAVLSQSRAGLENYMAVGSAGMEVIILIQAFRGELELHQFDAARKTLSDTQLRLLEARLDTSIFEKLQQTLVSTEIDWLLAGAIDILQSGIELMNSDTGLAEAQKNFATIQSLEQNRAEIEMAQQGITSLRQMKAARTEHDYTQATALLAQAVREFSGIGLSDGTFEAISQRLATEQQLWKALVLERDLNTWTSEAINALNRYPFSDETWEIVAVLVKRITDTNSDDHRGIAVSRALNGLQLAKQAMDDKRFSDSQKFIEKAQAELQGIGVTQSLSNAYRRLHQIAGNALQVQLTLAIQRLQEDGADDTALADARQALEPVLSFLPENPSARIGIATIDLIAAANAAGNITEYAKAARLLGDADRLLDSASDNDPLLAQLRNVLQNEYRRLAGQRPSPSEIYPLISVALQAIANNPLSSEMLDTADNLMQNVLGIQADEPTALIGRKAIDRLRAAQKALAEASYEETEEALADAETLLRSIGLAGEVLAPARRALKAAQNDQ